MINDLPSVKVCKKNLELFNNYLNTYEEIDQVWHENNPMEAVCINAKHLQEEYNSKIIPKNSH